MFDGRIYRAAFVPLLLVLAIAGFSLAGRPGSLHPTLAPDAFDGGRAFAELRALSERFPDRRAGSEGDERMAAYVAQTLRRLGGSAGGGFQVSTREVRAQTSDGARTLTTVIAERPGSTGASPIAILAHRDASGRGSAAELSGTAALLELARVFSQSETRRTIVLVSTSGGSAGQAGAIDFGRHGAKSLDAALVLGDLAGAHARRPFVLPFSSVPGLAPESLQRTLGAAISQEVGVDAGAPSAAAQLAHLAFPLATGEEAPLNGAGVPAVLVQVSGEQGPDSGEPISAARLESFGRAVLAATYALDEGPDIARDFSPRLSLGRKLLPGWAVRLLVLALLLPPLLVSVDALARLRRRREPVMRWVVWALSGSLPFLVCALFAILLGALGIVAAPTAQLSAASLAADGSAPGAVASSALVLVLALLAWPALVRRLRLALRPSADGAGVAAMLVLLAVALLAWALDPFACLLLVPAAHMGLLVVEGSRGGWRPPRARGTALLAMLTGALPIVLLLAYHARELGLGPGGLAESIVLALAGGQVGAVAALVWSAALGCLLALATLSLPGSAEPGPDEGHESIELSTRGPISYAGPGSLGGTESALRR
jgi:peptidase M28-like protein